VIVGIIFGEWAASGFGRLGHAHATALGFTLFGLGVQVVLGSFFLSLLTMRWAGSPSWPSNGRPAADSPITRNDFPASAARTA